MYIFDFFYEMADRILTKLGYNNPYQVGVRIYTPQVADPPGGWRVGPIRGHRVQRL